MENDKSMILEVLGDTPELRIIDFLIVNLHTPIYKNEIISRIGSNRNTFFRAWKNMEKYGIVKPYKKVGRATLYVLNKENKIVKWILKLDWALLERSFSEIEMPKKAEVAVRIEH